MCAEAAFHHHTDAQLQPRSWDAAIARLAERQHGVVARRQLTALGLGRGAIERRLERGRLHVLHRGVYAVGHRGVTRHGRWMAAVLAGGPGAVLSHHSAAALWGIRPTSRTRVDVTVPRTLHRRPDLLPHRAQLPGDETAEHAGIPVTSPARTLLDLAATLDRRRLERGLNEAEALRLHSPAPLAALLDRHPHRRGIANLRGLLDDSRSITRSELEVEFLAFLDAHRIQQPETNIVIDGLEVDAVWRHHNLIVELDSYAFHGTRAAFEADRARDRRLSVRGWRTIRVTSRSLTAGLAAELRTLHAGSSTQPPQEPAPATTSSAAA